MAYDGETLRRARLLAGLTQKQLGELVGSERSVGRWEETGVSDRSPWVDRLEGALRLKDPAVLRAIRDMGDDSETTESDPEEVDGSPAVDPRALGDGPLFALLNALQAESQRRYWERVNTPPRRRLHGQPTPYPHHLDANTTSQTGDGSSHDRAGSTG